MNSSPRKTEFPSRTRALSALAVAAAVLLAAMLPDAAQAQGNGMAAPLVDGTRPYAVGHSTPVPLGSDGRFHPRFTVSYEYRWNAGCAVTSPEAAAKAWALDEASKDWLVAHAIEWSLDGAVVSRDTSDPDATGWSWEPPEGFAPGERHVVSAVLTLKPGGEPRQITAKPFTWFKEAPQP